MSDDRPVLDQINLVVSDVAAAVEFYRLLGVEIADTVADWQRHHRNAVQPGGVDLDIDSSAFAQVWNQGTPGGRTGPVIGFRVATREAVDALYGKITAAGYTGEQAPYDAFWGSRYAVVADPDGTAIGIMSPRDPSQRKETPAPPAST